MRRRVLSRSPIQIELFPFLSVLACTIGTLILTIVIVSSQMLGGQQKEVKIVAKTEAGKNQVKTPVYIECRQDGILIHPQQLFVPAASIARTDSAFKQLLDRVSQNRDREYIIVALRPDGFQVFDTVRSLIEKEKINFGYEPFDKNWKLKL
ncbi:hypothetical protein [Oscillatoria sp. FACHB-1406]|uniref:hypothetical protein n=1 Tax=Oscillatoria sp. FACHB-1406 TaxID=2692846 RepID=UPI0016898CEE|nr:hypothetical protein [Oscillatoria sp. FACHB-1406]MBD2576884.1 hypothetical protein [Oscillatoria sp. FACHB-1406]